MENPTAWNFNPTASTANVVGYDSASRNYDVSIQPYDGYAAGQNPYNWKNATGWQNSLVYPAAQQYYGGPSYVPLYGGPTNWVANAGIVNQAGQYVPTQGADADLWLYDGGVAIAGYSDATVTYASVSTQYGGAAVGSGGLAYDSTTRDYDGTNNGESFDSWKTPTAWVRIAGGGM